MGKNNLPKRKQNRIPEYNYSNEGQYFITICTKDREKILGNIIRDSQNFEDSKMNLSLQGKIINEYINACNNKYNDLQIDEYVIMPNHVHMLITVFDENKSKTKSNETIPSFISALKRLTNKEISEQIWQRGYNDHVVRNENDLYRIKEYIEYNVYKWENDDYYI